MKKKLTIQSRQLSLKCSLHDYATFENFYTGANDKILHVLQNWLKDSYGHFIYLWGMPSVGRSHLAMATCQHFADLGLQVAYLDLTDSMLKTPKIFENMEEMFLFSLDNLNAIVGKEKWEKALFHCFNRLLHVGGNMLITASAPPSALDFILPDLKSRLSSCLIFQLHALTDEEKLAALNLRAKNRGLYLQPKIVRFLLQNYRRDLNTLFANLEKLAEASLRAKKALTIPFIKEVLE